MSVYKYPQSNVIDEVTFKKSEGGHLSAYLHAVDGANHKQLHAITCKLAEQGWQVTPYNLNGKPVLQATGMRSEQQALGHLKEDKLISGAVEIIRDKEDKANLKETIKKRSLAASGAFYLIGDAAFSAYGYKGGDKLNIAAGMMYGAGTLSLLGFGRKDQSDLQVRDLAKQMSQYMEDYGADLPKDCSLDVIANDYHKGVIRKADDLLRRYPSELMNLFFAGAGVLIAKSAYKHVKNPVPTGAEVEDVVGRHISGMQKKAPGLAVGETAKKALVATTEAKMTKMNKLEGKLDIGLGGMTGLSGLFAMLVKEKAPDPDAPPKHGAAAVWDKVREKPLAVAGAGYMVSTLCHAVSTTIAWNNSTTERRKSVKFRAIFIAANLVAETLLAISSKGHGHGVKSDGSVDDTVIALAAESISKQPVGMQNLLVEQVSRFLGKPETLALKNEEVEEKLRAQVELMRKNPWAVAASAAQQAAPAQPQQLVMQQQEKPCPTKACKFKKDPAWSARIAAEEPATEHLRS
ncbi:MAG: hypothetical protein ACN2B6_06795 [Rickettsiales bacterium]